MPIVQPCLAVGPVVGKGLARPFAGDQDTPTGVAKMLAAVRFALAGAGPHSLAGVLGQDAVAQPVRAAWRAWLVPERVGEPVSVSTLCVAVGLMA